jgi:hypothetical protein
VIQIILDVIQPLPVYLMRECQVGVMNMNKPEKTTQETKLKAAPGGRGVSYPQLSLEEAVTRAAQFWEYERKNSAPVEAAAAHWGYSATSSGGRTVVATLISFGLMTDSGSGESRQVQLTERALDIVLDTPEKAKALIESIKSPKIYAELFGLWSPENLPSDQTIKVHLLRNKNFNPKFVDGFIKDFRQSVRFSGIKNSDKMPSLDADEMVEELMRTPEMTGGAPVLQRDPVRITALKKLDADVTEVGAYPVAKDCTIRLLATGPYTRKSIEALVKQLELNLELDVFPHEPTATPEAKQ